jgi:hypothetical protein
MSVRGLNWSPWAGFLLSTVAFLSYPFVFERWPFTRDFPWANLLLFGLAAVLLESLRSRAYLNARVIDSVAGKTHSVAEYIHRRCAHAPSRSSTD